LRVRAVNTADYVGGLVDGRSFGIKIDIEGAEPAVLGHILGRKGVRFVVFEGDRNQQMLFDLFTTANFAIYGLRKTVIFPEVERVSNMTEWGWFHDFVAVPASPRLPSSKASVRRLSAAI
jgi:hypothetical protein